MLKNLLWKMGALGLLVIPGLAFSDNSPSITMATAGSSSNNSGAINRFTLRFSESMVPLGDPRATAPAAMECSVPAEGRWTDPQTYVFEFERSLPGGITCSVNLRADLTTQRGISIGEGKRFPIDTGGPSARSVMTSGIDSSIEENQVFMVATNSLTDAKSVANFGYCAVDGIGEKIALEVQPAKTVTDIVAGIGKDNYELDNFLEEGGIPSPLPTGEAARKKALENVLAVKCKRPLPPGQKMALVWDSRIADISGKAVGRDQRFDFRIRDAFTAKFECPRVNADAGCNPVEDAALTFTEEVDRKAALQARLTLADGTVVEPVTGNDEKNDAQITKIIFKGRFPGPMDGKITLPEDITDLSGRKLENAARFPLSIKFDAPPPLIKFAANFGILEAKEGGSLPVTVRAVEPELAKSVTSIGGASLRVAGADKDVAEWLRKLDVADDSDYREEKTGKGDATESVNYTGTTSLLNGAGDAMKLNLPGKGKSFEVVGIPFAKPGFYVVELASPVLGKALLGRDTTRYVSAGALVTNMAVHFKWGRADSLAWVTSIDTGKPLGGAAVSVSDSCTGEELASGTTDKQGRLIVKDNLPEPESSGNCETETHALMISARAGDDFSFTLTDWGKGIQPYDFDLPFGWSEREDMIHTVFDRSLLRAGDTVNMKHIMRRPVASGFAFAGTKTGTLTLTHSGSDVSFDLPVSIDANGVGQTTWTAPQSAPMGDYSMRWKFGEDTIYGEQSLRVDEFKLPTMRAEITGPKTDAVRPKTVPVSVFAGFLSGGGAANLPVSIRTDFSSRYISPEDYEGWSFGGRDVKAGTTQLDDNNESEDAPLPLSQTVPLTLDSSGTAKTNITIGQPIDEATNLLVEMDYQDANGETLTASKSIPLHPSAVQLGIKTEGWLMKEDDLRIQMVALDVDDKPMAGQRIAIALYSREIISARRRMVGGFYAYDNQEKVTKISGSCTGTTDKLGLAKCAIDPGISGEVTMVATTTDKAGNISRAVQSVWLAGDDEWWFGGDNGDRMDVIPEQKSYKAGETAKLQVRMPYRSATALVTVEREGVLSSFTAQLSGKDPVISVPMPAAYAPDVYVSVIAVRGRVGGFKLWLADKARAWNLPFFSREGASATALVDLAKPGYRIGIAKVKVGWEGHRLGIKVTSDKPKYAVRDTAQVDLAVTTPDGKPAKSADVAFAAVDEALLQLGPNESWKLLDAMMGERTLDVLTSTAQMQIVGKRHYGLKAVKTGGGGGGDLSGITRSDFRPVLLWKGKVPLDANGKARVAVPLSDAQSSFRLVAIGTNGAQFFGTGEAKIRTAQDLTIFSGIPELVRSGDSFGATFTLRNGSDKEMTVTADMKLSPAIAEGPPLTVKIPAGGATAVNWNVAVPEGITALGWTVNAKAANSKATDSIAVNQVIVPSVPVEVWAGTLARVGAATNVSIKAPAGALPGGYVDVKLSDTLAPPLAGVRAYMSDYPYSCFEQQLSRSVVLNDAGAWTALSNSLPTYLDDKGLLRYFPSNSMKGSAELTAYAMSMTAAAGYVVPEEPKQKMLAALKSIAEGRTELNGGGMSDARLIRISALAALARNGASTPGLVSGIDIAPADMPTSALADWLVIVNGTKGLTNGDVLHTTAEAELRKRLVYEGTRMDIADSGRAPWWMMVSADEMAIKALDAVLGRSNWNDETPKMMVGLAMRQQRGHWDTTPANAWGSILTRRFAALYPASAIQGTTTATLGGVSKTQGWPMAADASPLRLPMADGMLELRQSSASGPWANISVAAAVPLTKPLFAGYKLKREVTVVSRKVEGQFTRGDVLKIRLTVEATADRNWVVISDPVPAGATIVGNLGGQSGILAAAASGGSGEQPSYVERAKGEWRGYFAWMPAGTTVTEYVVRLNGSGDLKLPPTRVEAMYSPAIRAQVPNSNVKVLMR
jgi:alpha-2-macroglobulin